MNFALACLVILALGAFWTWLGARWWMRDDLVEQIDRDPETRMRGALR